MKKMNLNKKELRQIIYKKRNELNDDIKSNWDSSILEKLLENKFYKNSKVIFTYVSFGGEVDTLKFIERALTDGKTICVPKVISKKEGMEAYKINSLNDLEKGFYGILEPKGNAELIDPSEIDMIIMPGVAFDKTNGRIGYGGGFYDRFLRRVSPDTGKIALSYAFQIFDSIPTEEFDEKVDFIITNE
jgi:5-formyltetrahydrofolate cyclo-ligase